MYCTYYITFILNCRGIFASIVEIYKQNGLLGFLSGLVPRILGDVISLLLASALTYVVNNFIFEEKELQMYSSATMSVSINFFLILRRYLHVL